MTTIATGWFLVVAVLCAVVLVLAALAAAAYAVTGDRATGWAAMAAPFVLQALAAVAGLAAFLSLVLNVVRYAKGA